MFLCDLTALVSVDLFQPTTVSQTNISLDTSATLGSGDTCREQDWYVNMMTVMIRAVATTEYTEVMSSVLCVLDGGIYSLQLHTNDMLYILKGDFYIYLD